ncbi:MAG: cache domain-containing protein, partial [Pleurocapsa sp.]
MQNTITLPLLLQIFVTVSLVGYFSWRNGERSVNKITIQLRNEVTERVEQHLEEYLNTPHLIVRLKQNSIKTGQLKVNDFKTIAQDFWLTINLFDSVRAIYLADNAGKFIYSKREKNKFYSIEVITIPQRKTYILDDRGEKQELITEDKYFPQSRPWYINTLKTQRNNWSEVYTFTGGELGITAAGLLQDSRRETQGVVGVDLVLDGIDRFLEKIEISENGQVFILERSGYLIATSSPEKPFTIDSQNNQEQRLKAIDSQENLIKATTANIADSLDRLDKINRPQQFEFKLDKAKQLVQILPYQDKLGLDWLIVVVLPEADFMAEINANNFNTICLCLLAGAIATCLGIYTSRKIAQPLTHLSQMTNFIAKSARAKNTSTYFYPIVKAKSIKELQSLADSFNEMATQLKTAFRELEHANTTLEKRVEQRTTAMIAAKEAADAAIHAKSQFLASMSHEFRTTLHVILGFTLVALQDTSVQPQQRENLLTVKSSGEHLLT